MPLEFQVIDHEGKVYGLLERLHGETELGKQEELF